MAMDVMKWILVASVIIGLKILWFGLKRLIEATLNINRDALLHSIEGKDKGQHSAQLR